MKLEVGEDPDNDKQHKQQNLVLNEIMIRPLLRMLYRPLMVVIQHQTLNNIMIKVITEIQPEVGVPGIQPGIEFFRGKINRFISLPFLTSTESNLFHNHVNLFIENITNFLVLELILR